MNARAPKQATSRSVPLDAEDWDRLPARFGFDPAHQAEWRDLLAALRRAVDTELTPRQREVLVAIVLNGVPLDTLVLSAASSRNAIYKMLFDARRKLRPLLPLTGIYPMTVRGAHERLAGAGPVLAD
jgi:RNA polymerase sigma-70 factor (ECF subfamily)